MDRLKRFLVLFLLFLGVAPLAQAVTNTATGTTKIRITGLIPAEGWK